MPTFIRYSCKRCASHIATQDAYHSIGEPFLICPKCNAISLISNNRNEWQLKSPVERFAFQSKVILFSILLGCGTGVLINELAKRYLQFSLGFFLSALAGTALWYLLMGSDMRRQIRESQARMLDPKYKDLLARLGIITSKE